MSQPAQARFALCIHMSDGDDLELRKAYAVLPAANGAGFLRVVDESGEDYLYPAEMLVLKG